MLIDQSYSMEVGDQLEQASGSRPQTSSTDSARWTELPLVAFSQGANVLARSTSDRASASAARSTRYQVSSGATRFGPGTQGRTDDPRGVEPRQR